MIKSYRKYFNSNFSRSKYLSFRRQVEEDYLPAPVRFAETPVFIPAALREELIKAGEEILTFIRRADFIHLTEEAIPAEWRVPAENSHPHFLALDFSICRNEAGQLEPRLIELQGFPSLFGLQSHLADCYIQAFELDKMSSLTPYFGMDRDAYFDLLKKVILGTNLPEEVALVDRDAPHQRTAIDFFITQKHLGIPILSLTDIFQEGKQLFYWDGPQKIRLKRIYNRLIFDELKNGKELFELSFNPLDDLDIEWITHPNWFYRISKFMLPLLKSPYVPETYFLHQLEQVPEDLENYVLKPLFSFAGKGVIIDLSASDLAAISDPQNWILQKKVNYEPVIQSPHGLVKAEIRLMYLWPDNEEPRLAINLVRMSRGKMIGVSYNSDFDWVGGTVGLMDQENYTPPTS